MSTPPKKTFMLFTVGPSGTRFGEDYWKAFRTARRRQLESLSQGDAQVQGGLV